MRLLFQGDSITDAGRGADGIGKGYVKYAIEYIKEKYPNADIEFINKGISGNKVCDLLARLDKDFLDLEPDMVSIMIGINDTWHHMPQKDFIPDEQFEADYRAILTALKDRGIKIMMIEPFVISEDKLDFYQDLYKKILIERKLAREFADVYLPLDGLLASAWCKNPADYFSADGVHPNHTTGAQYIAKLYLEYASPIIESLI
ncbi:MAG: GDSL family lipase [Ruminococcaceae bacterium]|nr:GDSL family lipase [Oscillospiraceae bacterium]